MILGSGGATVTKEPKSRDKRTQAESADKLLSPPAVLFNFLRRRFDKNVFVSLLRSLRAAIHFGPWRVVPQFLIRRCKRARTVHDASVSLLCALDADAIAQEVRLNSVAVLGVLPADFVERLRTVSDRLPANQYELMHLIDKNVRVLSEDPLIKNILGSYFGCDPVLLESNLMITVPHTAHRRLADQNSFHFDYAGWKSLNVFVYLTDVTAAGSHHIVAKGSHRNRSLRDAFRGSLTDDEALRRFGSSIQPITGPAGTIFLEDTEAFHKRHPGDSRRAMLNLLYASHRSWLSHGRTSRKHIQNRARLYEKIRQEVESTGASF